MVVRFVWEVLRDLRHFFVPTEAGSFAPIARAGGMLKIIHMGDRAFLHVYWPCQCLVAFETDDIFNVVTCSTWQRACFTVHAEAQSIKVKSDVSLLGPSNKTVKHGRTICGS